MYLAAVAYDPATAVTTKSTAAAQAMTAFDTTNLRLTFSVPASGRVAVRINCTVHGGTAPPSVLLGVLEGATVRLRVAPNVMWTGTPVATSFVGYEILAPVTGLTPGASLTWDAAWGVETGVASSAIKYGGPNNATANDAFGALVYEIYAA